MKKTVVFLVVLFFTISTYSQLKVVNCGKVNVGGEPIYTQTAEHLATLSIFGQNGTCMGGGRISFGDYGTSNGAPVGVVVGEYGDEDTDMLHLHGKHGIYLTGGTNLNNIWMNIIAYYNVNEDDAFIFNCPIKADGVWLTSDERCKTNIEELKNSKDQLKALNGVSYNFSFPEDSQRGKKVEENSNVIYKENDSVVNVDSSKKKLGFLAQDLQKVFPELVKEDADGFLSVDYIGLIPVLVEGFKTQQSTIDAQVLEIEFLKDQMYLIVAQVDEIKADLISSQGSGKSEVSTRSSSIVELSDTTETETATANATTVSSNKVSVEAVSSTPVESPSAVLQQNYPNPFSENTIVKYYLPDGISNATIYIYDMNGKQLQTYPLEGMGNGSLEISSSELYAGLFTYALVVDGVLIDSKQMVLTQ